ncbi:MAG: hypothetical protein H6502_03410 [Candidatus Woesearchaeota archaeon]|nr:MAG: hypothetical protein H6502_03410 [Candidatus Woesearchaeota archaeon]
MRWSPNFKYSPPQLDDVIQKVNENHRLERHVVAVELFLDPASRLQGVLAHLRGHLIGGDGGGNRFYFASPVDLYTRPQEGSLPPEDLVCSGTTEFLMAYLSTQGIGGPIEVLSCVDGRYELVLSIDYKTAQASMSLQELAIPALFASLRQSKLLVDPPTIRSLKRRTRQLRQPIKQDRIVEIIEEFFFNINKD